jgi:hypothetical protein
MVALRVFFSAPPGYLLCCKDPTARPSITEVLASPPVVAFLASFYAAQKKNSTIGEAKK